MTNDTFGRVFNGNDTVVTGSSKNLPKHFINSGLGYTNSAITKMFERCFLSKGPFRPKKSNLDRLLKGQAGRHNLSKQSGHILVVDRSSVSIHNMPQHLSLALGTIVRSIAEAFLNLGDLLGEICTLTDALHNLNIQRVNLIPEYQ